MKKTILSILTLIVILSICVSLAAATGTGSLSLTDAEGKQGDTVAVCVDLSSNPGLITMKFSISYPDDLELISVENSELLHGWTQPAPTISSPYTLRWADALATNNNTASGKLVTLTFKIKDSATPGTKTVSLTFQESWDTVGGKNFFANASATIKVNCKSCNFTNYVSNNDATYDADGTKTAICDLCGSVSTVTDTGSKLIRNGWWDENGNWVYYEKDVKVTNDWRLDSKGWCYLTADGTMATNEWIMDSVGWCYVGADGYCVTNSWQKDSAGWCYLDTEGRMVYNRWVKDSTGWCYVDSSGYMVYNQWVKDSHGWCYVGSTGYMVTNTWVQDSKGWCYIGADGYAVTNCWQKDSTGWCYLDSEGSMVKNDWVYDNGWYYLDGNGYMIYNTSRYIGNKTYYFNASGLCTNP